MTAREIRYQRDDVETLRHKYIPIVFAANQTASVPMKFSWTPSGMANVKLVVTAEDPTFDEATMQKWREEGFNISYLPLNNSPERYAHTIEHLSDPLALNENYAIVGLLTLAQRFQVHQCQS